MERVKGIEPSRSAWKAEVLPLNYTRLGKPINALVEGEGFEPSKAEPSDLQSDPFDRSGTPPNEAIFFYCSTNVKQIIILIHKWCWHQESNPGPTDYKSVALPSELCQRGIKKKEPGDNLLSHGKSHTIIGVHSFHF